MTEYDIAAAFQAIEEELIASMIRNMDRHRAEEGKEGYQWSMWQAEQLKALEKYKRDNRKKYQKQFQSLNAQMEELIRISREKGNMQQESLILKNICRGYRFPGIPDRIYNLLEEMDGRPFKEKAALVLKYISGKKAAQGTAEFFRLNDRKLEALIKATIYDMERAETAILRKANDDYRKAIFNAQVYVNTGAGTYEKAVDMATKDMLSRGLNCVVYANGARHTLADYADMAIRTASKRAYLQGEGEMRKKWGISTVIVNKRGNPCPKCLPFCGKVLIDDVWSGGKASDGPYPLISKAIEAGLYHPRCKDSHTTYFPGISTADDTWTQEELEEIGQKAKQETRKQHAQRQAERFGRLAAYSLDAENRRAYERKAEEWGDEADGFKEIKRVLEKMSDHEPTSIFNLKSEYREDILDIVNNAPSEIQRFITRHRDAIVIINEFARLGNREGKKGIRVNLKRDLSNERGKWTGIFHEIGHRVDRLSGRMSQRPEFKKALEEDFENLVTGYQKMYNCNRKEAYADIGNMAKAPEFHSVSDLFGAMSKNQCVGNYYHHDIAYWNKPNRLGREAFAHFFEAVCRRDSKKIDILKQTFPKAYKMFEDMMEELV